SSPFFFFNDTATTEIYTLSLHDALPISRGVPHLLDARQALVRQHVVVHGGDARGTLRPAQIDPYHIGAVLGIAAHADTYQRAQRSEEHTSELQSRGHLVCRLLLEKKKN